MKSKLSAKDRLIVALDFPTLTAALRMVDQLEGSVSYYKVGLEMITSEGGPKIVRELLARGHKVFYDAKFHDIPNTVAQASRAAAELGVSLFNVHASNGRQSLKAAAANKVGAKAIAVTVLTSFSNDECVESYRQSVDATVLKFAHIAKESGLDGIVCSPQELLLLQDDPTFKEFLKVTPGVRPEWAMTNDQKRVTTPKEALLRGASHLVIGRPITQPPTEIGSPRDAAQRVLEEMESAL